MTSDILSIGLAQIAPVWLNREQTLEKILTYVEQAAKQGCDLVVFGEALLPGYPFWLELTDGARFNSDIQKDIHAHYMANAVCIEQGHLDILCDLAKGKGIAIYLGTIERPLDRGGHSLYCSLVYIDKEGIIQNVHRKLMPTYEERLSWSWGDGYGLRTFPLGAFTVSGLNCWENWMPLARTALYSLGEDLHIAVWPGNRYNTFDITPFTAKEGRSYVMAVSGLMRKTDIPTDIPHHDLILKNAPDILADGGTCASAPDGSWLVEPFSNEEKLVVTQIDHKAVRRERQNFDAVGHYSRSDVLQLQLNRQRQRAIAIKED